MEVVVEGSLVDLPTRLSLCTVDELEVADNLVYSEVKGDFSNKERQKLPEPLLLFPCQD